MATKQNTELMDAKIDVGTSVSSLQTALTNHSIKGQEYQTKLTELVEYLDTQVPLIDSAREGLFEAHHAIVAAQTSIDEKMKVLRGVSG